MLSAQRAHVVDAAHVGVGDLAGAAHLREEALEALRIVFECRREELEPPTRAGAHNGRWTILR